MPGLWFEQFEIGQRFVHEVRRTVTDADNILFSALTYNPAAIHIDHRRAVLRTLVRFGAFACGVNGRVFQQ